MGHKPCAVAGQEPPSLPPSSGPSSPSSHLPRGRGPCGGLRVRLKRLPGVQEHEAAIALQRPLGDFSWKAEARGHLCRLSHARLLRWEARLHVTPDDNRLANQEASWLKARSPTPHSCKRKWRSPLPEVRSLLGWGFFLVGFFGWVLVWFWMLDNQERRLCLEVRRLCLQFARFQCQQRSIHLPSRQPVFSLSTVP